MSVYIKGMEMPVDCLACRVACDKESYMVIGRPPKCPLAEAPDGDLIGRAETIEAVELMEIFLGERKKNAVIRGIQALPSAETSQNLAKPIKALKGSDLISRAEVHKTLSLLATEGGTDAKMLLSDAHEFIDALPSAEAEPTMTEEVREALMRLTMCAREECGMCKYKDECGFDFQYKISTENMNTILDAFISAEAVQGWIPCSERLPDVDVEVLTTTDWSEVLIAWYRKDGTWETDEYILASDEILAWMPLPKPYKGGDNE